jgi:hypothetical protein
MTARDDDDRDDVRDEDREDGRDDDALPADTLAALRQAWSALPAPEAARDLADEDEATQQAVAWLVSAWNHPAVHPAAHAAPAEHPPLALRAAQRRMSGARTRAWRQVAAAALLVALLGAALLLRDVLDARTPAGRAGAEPPVAADGAPAPREPGAAPDEPGATPDSHDAGPGGDVAVLDAAPAEVAGDEPPMVPGARDAGADGVAVRDEGAEGFAVRDAGADDVAARDAGAEPGADHGTSAPAPPRAYDAVTIPPLVAAGGPAPIEMRAGHTRLILFTHATLPELAP